MPEGRDERGLDYGGVIRRLREGRGLTMDALAESAGISTSYLSEVERGLKRPSTDVIAKVADALDMRASEFLELVESGLMPERGLFDQRITSPRSRALYFTRPKARDAAGQEAAAPAPPDDQIESLLSLSRQLDGEDLKILIELARKLGRTKK